MRNKNLTEENKIYIRQTFVCDLMKICRDIKVNENNLLILQTFPAESQ